MKNFKTFFLLLVFGAVLQSCMVSKKQNANFFNEDTPGFSDANYVKVNVPMWLAKPVVKIALRDEPDGPAMIALLKKISDVQIFTVQNSSKELNRSFARFMNQRDLEPWVSVKKDSETIDFSVQRKSNQIRKFLIAVKSDAELVYIDVSGKFTEKDLSDLINYSRSHDATKAISRTRNL